MWKELLTNKYKLIIFVLVILVTVFIAASSMAINPDKHLDTDNDGLTDYEEKAVYQTFWNDKDSDDDGYDDGLEVENNYSPKQKGLKMYQADTDNDGLNDAWEIKLGTNLMVRDTDEDGYLDGTEVYNSYSPTDPNSKLIEKRIEVNIKDFTLKFYFGEILLDTFIVSNGKPSTPTPKGEFKIINKVPSKTYGGYGYSFYYPNTKWNLHFTTGRNGLRYYIHGAYWHDVFGVKNVSGGCVNVKYEDMERLYKFTNIGTKVIIN